MTLVVRAVTALALLAFATPALPCGDKEKTTTASSSGTASEQVAKAGTAAKGEKQKKAATREKAETKPATAAN